MSYVFFLLERMKYKQQALQELLNAEKNKPAFDIQFVIYRYKYIRNSEKICFKNFLDELLKKTLLKVKMKTGSWMLLAR
jgi:hypothetical protein